MKMEQREATAWALYLSESWYTIWENKPVMIGLGVTRSAIVGFKARSIVEFDRTLTSLCPTACTASHK